MSDDELFQYKKIRTADDGVIYPSKQNKAKQNKTKTHRKEKKTKQNKNTKARKQRRRRSQKTNDNDNNNNNNNDKDKKTEILLVEKRAIFFFYIHKIFDEWGQNGSIVSHSHTVTAT